MVAKVLERHLFDPGPPLRGETMELLSGWKEIADHLHLGVRTAQRWEHLGLPIHRVSGSNCSPVVAVADELELWARGRKRQADGYRLESQRVLELEWNRLRLEHRREHRKARRLTRQVELLQGEHQRLLCLISRSLKAIRAL